MNALARWWRFNVVGAAGVLVQLGSLALLDRALPYLAASVVAVELAVLHNFAWHLRYTWRDRRDETGWTMQMVRFHLSNGVVSLAGNVALMRMLVGAGHMPVLAANGIAIVCCSVVNFVLGDRWVFA